MLDPLTLSPMVASKVSEMELRYARSGRVLGVAVVADWMFVGEDGQEKIIRVVMSLN